MNPTHYKLFRIYGYPGFAFILYLVMALINPYDRSIGNWQILSGLEKALDVVVNIGYAAIIFETGIQLTQILNRKLQWDRGVITRFVVQSLLHITVIILIFTLFFQTSFPEKLHYDQLTFRQASIIGIIFSLLITIVFTTEHFFYKWNASRIEVLVSKKNSVQAQLDALKLQLDPHFLFNNLSTLTSLIEEDQRLAVDYVINLASIYRYMLNNRVQNTIQISEEIEFIRAYLFLYKIRYGEAINISMPEIKSSKNKRIAPLTLQLLVENAIKHNLFSRNHPLMIYIYFQDKYIVIQNNKNPQPNKEISSKMGLKNIIERYMLLGHIEPLVKETIDSFEVKVPLLEY